MLRYQPNGPPQAYQTFRMHSPRDVTVVSACEQVGCDGWRTGWDTIIDERTDLGMAQAAYIRQRCGRTFREMSGPEPGITVFRFEAHQRCFTEHRTRPESYSVLAGDWRAKGGILRRHTRPQDFAEDIHEQIDHVWTRKAQG